MTTTKYDSQSEGLKGYRSIKIVRAAEIRHAEPITIEGLNHWAITTTDGKKVTVQMKGRPSPSTGWWVIFYPDGYASFSPPESFLEGYAEV